MSTPRKIDAKTAAKRRANRRKQTRETLRRFGALLIVAILVIGTVATVFVTQGTQTAIAPTVPVVAPTSPSSTSLDTLITQADQAGTKGDWAGAVNLYSAYLSQNNTNADVHFKLGKAYLSTQPPDYPSALGQLQQAMNINPNGSFVPEAGSLINQYKDKVPSPAAITNTVGTRAGTTQPAAGITGTANPAGTLPLTGTTAPLSTTAPTKVP